MISDFAKQDRQQTFRRAVLHVYADWHSEHPPQQINNGWCEEFATAVIDRLDQWGYDAEMVGCEVGGDSSQCTRCMAAMSGSMTR